MCSWFYNPQIAEQSILQGHPFEYFMLLSLDMSLTLCLYYVHIWLPHEHSAVFAMFVFTIHL